MSTVSSEPSVADPFKTTASDDDLHAANDPFKTTHLPAVDQATPRPDDATPPTKVRCPSCHNPIELAKESNEVLCPGCGNTFLLCDAQSTETVGGMKQMGKFQLRERLGLGGFGAVWKARDTELDRIVALKIPHTGLLTEKDDLERFQREARAAAQLRHPNIVSVYEVATLNGLPVIVSEFVPGVPLKDLLEVNRLSFRQTAALIAQVADALEYAHWLGVVHRDIKPANIMIFRHDPPSFTGRSAGSEGASGVASQTHEELADIGKPMILDFGLALREGAAETTMTMEGQLLGTPAYMSPEQAAGQSHQADRRSDVYSLGVVMYQMLTGELPFRGTRMMMLDQVMREEPRPPREINDKVPRDLETICLKCMAKAPAGRYATARELAEDLRRYLAGEPILARRVTKVERFWRWCRRNPGLAVTGGVAVAAVVVALVTLTVAFLWVSAAANRAFESARDKDELAKSEHEQRIVAEKLATDNKVLADNAIKARLDAEERREHTETLALQVSSQQFYLNAKDNPHRGMLQTANLVSRAASLKNRSLLDSLCLHLSAWSRVNDTPVNYQHGAGVFAVLFSPDARTVLTGSTDKTAWLWETAAGKQTGRPLQHPDRIWNVAFSPDGKQVLTGCLDGQARLWDTATGKLIGKPFKHDEAVTAVAFSPDGKTVLTGSRDAKVRLWDIDSGQAIGQPLKHDDAVTVAVFSPDGKTVLTGSRDKFARLWVIATGKVQLLPHPGEVLAVAFSPDGKTVLTTNRRDTDARLWLTATGSLHRTLPHLKPVLAFAFSSDSTTVLTACKDSKTRLWETVNGTIVGPFLWHDSEVRSVAFSPDGKIALTGGADNKARFWEISTGKQLGTDLAHEAPVQAVAFSRDGKSAVTGSEDKTAKLWKVPQVLRGEPERIRVWVQVVAEAEVDSVGRVKSLDDASLQKRKQQLNKLGGPPVE